MLPEHGELSSHLAHVSSRVHATPNFVAQGVGASLAAHVAALGGYSLYVLCAAWWTSADLPEWVPPRAGVRSVAQVAAQPIQIEAAWQDAAERRQQAVSLQIAKPPVPRPSPLAPRDVPFPSTARPREARTSRPIPTEPSLMTELEPDPEISAQRRESLNSPDVTQQQMRPTATVRKRGHGVALESISSAASAPSREDDGVQTAALPQKVYSPVPEYPRSEYAAGIGGQVKVGVRLDAAGRVAAAWLHRTSGVPALDQAALQAVRRWRFEPSSTGRTTARELVVPIRFIPPARRSE